MNLTHLDATGQVHMVDVGNKTDTERRAVARGAVIMQPETLRLIVESEGGSGPIEPPSGESDTGELGCRPSQGPGLRKGNVLTTAQIAGIMAAKRTSELIPLCHPLAITQVTVDFEIDTEHSQVIITASAATRGKTGVEMEALTAVSVAALTIYDMAKAVEKTMRITDIRLLRKEGGKSGTLVLEERAGSMIPGAGEDDAR